MLCLFEQAMRLRDKTSSILVPKYSGNSRLHFWLTRNRNMCLLHRLKTRKMKNRRQCYISILFSLAMTTIIIEDDYLIIKVLLKRKCIELF